MAGPRRHARRRDPLAAVVADQEEDLAVVELDDVVEVATQVGGLGSRGEADCQVESGDPRHRRRGQRGFDRADQRSGPLLGWETSEKGSSRSADRLEGLQMGREPVARPIRQMQASERRRRPARAPDRPRRGCRVCRIRRSVTPQREDSHRFEALQNAAPANVVQGVQREIVGDGLNASPGERPSLCEEGEVRLGSTVADAAAQALLRPDQDLIAQEALPEALVEESRDPSPLLVITLSEAKHRRFAAGEVTRPIHEGLRCPGEVFRGGYPIEDGRRHVTHGS